MPLEIREIVIKARLETESDGIESANRDEFRREIANLVRALCRDELSARRRMEGLENPIEKFHR